MRALAILGSTGSIGRSVLDVVRALDGRLEVRSLAARTSAREMAEQVAEFRPKRAVMVDESAAEDLRSLVPEGVEVLAGEEGLVELARDGWTLAMNDLRADALEAAAAKVRDAGGKVFAVTGHVTSFKPDMQAIINVPISMN